MQKIFIICCAPRSGSSALLKRLNLHESIGLIPEYDIPNMVKALNIPFQKYKFTSSKAWVQNVDRTNRFGQTTADFLSFIPNPDSAANLLKKVFEDTFDNKELEIIGEKYPRYWVLDLPSLLANPAFDTKLLFIFRNPLAVHLSYKHRSALSAKKKDVWSFKGAFDGLIHWLLGWHLYIEHYKKYEHAIIVKYENMSSNEFSRDLNGLLGLNQKIPLMLESTPSVNDRNVCESIVLDFLSEIAEDWSVVELRKLLEKYDLGYFRRRYLRTLMRRPQNLLTRDFGRLGLTLLFINQVVKMEQLRHRYKFLSWTIRKVL